MSTNNPMDRVFDSTALSAQRQVTNWVAIKKELGTKVAGIFVGFWNVPPKGKFRAQTGVAMRDFKDETIVHGINLPEYFQDIVSEWNVGDEVGFEYYKDKPATEAGMSPTKQIRDFNPDLEERKKRGEVIVKKVAEQGEDDEATEGYDADAEMDKLTGTDVPQGGEEGEDDPF